MSNLPNLRKNLLFYLIDNSASELEIYRDFRKYRNSVVKHALNQLEKDGDIRRYEYDQGVVYAAITEREEIE